MRSILFATLSLAGCLALLDVANPAHCQALAYSFESNLQGFTANGSGIQLSQSTIGATEGAHSIKAALNANTSFAGMLTTQLHPRIGNPPGVDHILFDLTIPEPFGPPPHDSGFARIGVIMFAATQPDDPDGQMLGLQLQFMETEVAINGLSPGTHHDLRIDLNNVFHPLTFLGPFSFNDLFGSAGSASDDLIPTGFQLYVNKSIGASYPLTLYIDNIRVVAPEPSSALICGTSALALVAGLRRRC